MRRLESPKLQEVKYIVTDRFGSVIYVGDTTLSDETLCSLIGLDSECNTWADRMGGMAGWGFVVSNESGEFARFID